MNVQDTLKNCLLKYPNIFRNKWSVYHFLFCVNGNGYEWKNGELVLEGENSVITLENSLRNIFDNRNYTISKVKELVLMNIDLEQRIKDFNQYEKTIYNLYEYAKICNIPKNIKEDWYKAAKEFYNFLSNSENQLREDDKMFLVKIKKDLDDICYCAYNKNDPTYCILCGKPRINIEK